MIINKEDIEKYVDMSHIIRIEQNEGGFFVSIPDLSGCMSQGETLSEAYSMIMDAKAAWIEAALKNNESIPKPSETCFKYEQRIAELEEEVKKGMVAALKLKRVREIVK